MVENSYKSIKTKSEVSTGNGETSLGQDKVWSNLKMTNCHVTSKYLPHSATQNQLLPSVLKTCQQPTSTATEERKGRKHVKKKKTKTKNTLKKH